MLTKYGMTTQAIPFPRTFSLTGGPREPKDQEPKDPKRWERRAVFLVGWIIGLIIMKAVFGVDL